jgi:hypothetical protein
MINARGADAALFESVAVALGYKNNKLPFQLLAQRVSLAAAASRNGEAMLFGLAGFLEKPEPPAGAARTEVAALWSDWWKLRAAHANAILPRQAWKLTGVRPANHPLRRIGALAALAKRWKSVRTALESADLSRLEHVLGSLEHPFWSFHTTWKSPRRKKSLALLGSDRIREIHANIALPLALARGEEPTWLDIPGGPPNTSLRVVSSDSITPSPSSGRRLFLLRLPTAPSRGRMLLQEFEGVAGLPPWSLQLPVRACLPHEGPRAGRGDLPAPRRSPRGARASVLTEFALHFASSLSTGSTRGTPSLDSLLY